ncbi:MAG: GHKL domain-containing protein [Oscillatoriales cyanobacterium]|nr:MAG: GHKL domain-containing protein [Oscillatoriales cyanobacterium]TAH21803.1 MAG: GHKL domain-containing protein [Oscillatoriales cyanobacterium]
MEKANRILQKKLERSETERVQLEIDNEKKTLLLKQVISDLEQSQSELKQKQNELEVAFKNLQTMQDKMANLGSLVAGVAHEINNPIGFLAGNLQPARDYITDLLGLLDLYQQKFPNPGIEINAEIEAINLDYLREDLPKLIASMQEGINRIRDISSSLRTFSRADSDHPVAFNIHQGIDSTLLILKHRLKANDLRPTIEVIKQYSQLPLVECYAGQLSQVFMNIFANAIDALEEGSSQYNFSEIQASPNIITIGTECTQDGKHVCIRIKDNGVGLPEDIKQKVFDYLFTTKAVGQGTGLGLAIAHQIVVDKHKGTLTVNSASGQGTEFVISLPIKADVTIR